MNDPNNVIGLAYFANEADHRRARAMTECDRLMRPRRSPVPTGAICP